MIEYIEGEYFVVMGVEFEGQKRRVLAKELIEAKGAKLKLVYERGGVAGHYEVDGEWKQVGKSGFPSQFGAMKRWGLFTQDGLSDEERWASFGDVRY